MMFGGSAEHLIVIVLIFVVLILAGVIFAMALMMRKPQVVRLREQADEQQGERREQPRPAPPRENVPPREDVPPPPQPFEQPIYRQPAPVPLPDPNNFEDITDEMAMRMGVMIAVTPNGRCYHRTGCRQTRQGGVPRFIRPCATCRPDRADYFNLNGNDEPRVFPNR